MTRRRIYTLRNEAGFPYKQQILVQRHYGKVSFWRMIGWKERTPLFFFASLTVLCKKEEVSMFEPIILSKSTTRLFHSIKEIPCMEEKQTPFLRVWSRFTHLTTTCLRMKLSQVSCLLYNRWLFLPSSLIILSLHIFLLLCWSLICVLAQWLNWDTKP